mmetsp:Transcript_24081/g.42526  ORF Transcript_24081/g.42526 Transcript_24081/m.42526 type:complete len:318 (-) Transcript_24081:89-1042(-)
MFEGVRRALAFYRFGRKECTQTGWKKHARLQVDHDLSGRVYVVTGANSGIGKELTSHLFSKGAKVYMVCRNEGRGAKAREEIATKHEQRDADLLQVIIADVGVKADVENAVKEISGKENAVDGLVCNAGGMLNEHTLTVDGVETIFASHFLFGTYALSLQMAPLLKKVEDPRIVVVSSGGMYSSPLYSLKRLMDNKAGYNPQLVYAQAKRAQVTLGEFWDTSCPEVPMFVAHPGWTLTPGVEGVYGRVGQWLLSPLRTLWEGTEGLAWLAMTETSNLQKGEFYLDGIVQPKHLHSSTKVPLSKEVKFISDLKDYLKE